MFGHDDGRIYISLYDYMSSPSVESLILWSFYYNVFPCTSFKSLSSFGMTAAKPGLAVCAKHSQSSSSPDLRFPGLKHAGFKPHLICSPSQLTIPRRYLYAIPTIANPTYSSNFSAPQITFQCSLLFQLLKTRCFMRWTPRSRRVFATSTSVTDHGWYNLANRGCPMAARR
jgi:hypothetical protein